MLIQNPARESECQASSSKAGAWEEAHGGSGSGGHARGKNVKYGWILSSRGAAEEPAYELENLR